jgi:hypothetical protein
VIALLQIAVPDMSVRPSNDPLHRQRKMTYLKIGQASVSAQYGHDQLIQLCLKPLLLRGCQLFRIVDKGTVGVKSYLTFFLMDLITSGYIVVTIFGVLFFWILELLVVIVDCVIVFVVRVDARFLGACAEIDVQEVRPATYIEIQRVSRESIVISDCVFVLLPDLLSKLVRPEAAGLDRPLSQADEVVLLDRQGQGRLPADPPVQILVHRIDNTKDLSPLEEQTPQALVFDALS